MTDVTSSCAGKERHPSIAEHAALLGVGNAPEIGLKNDAEAATLIRLSQPTIPTETDNHFLAFWCSAQRAIDSFIARHT